MMQLPGSAALSEFRVNKLLAELVAQVPASEEIKLTNGIITKNTLLVS